jgi:hypothetical protein
MAFGQRRDPGVMAVLTMLIAVDGGASDGPIRSDERCG